MPGIYAKFTGVQSVLSASFTLGHGSSPSVGIVEMLPQDALIPQVGDLVLGNEGRSVTLWDCLVDQASIRNSGGRTVSFRVLDHRWRWQFGSISGRYNVRNSANKLESASEKTPQELAALLFQAMGESSFNVSQLPNDSRPEVEWVESNPATELEELADSLGCRIVPKMSGSFSLEKLGSGSGIPQGSVISKSGETSAAPKPSAIECVTGPARFQQCFLLEAVGKDTDGKIKKIDDLSYTPSTGWSKESPYDLLIDSTDEKVRALANETVFRWYRIKDEISVVGYPQSKKLKDILPINDYLVDQDVDADGVETPKKGKVDGVFWNDDPGKVTDSTVRVEYKKPWSLDGERGIVQFGDFVVSLDATTGDVSPANMYLTCSFSARDSENRQTVRYLYNRPVSGGIAGTKKKVIRRDEIIPTVKQNYDASGIPTTIDKNTGEVDQEINYYLDAAETAFVPSQAEAAEYAGIEVISPDGAIQQITWEVFSGRGAITRISRNSEHDPATPSYEEFRQKKTQKRAAEILKSILVAARKSALWQR